MFNPVLRKVTDHRMVISTSFVFRAMFAVIAAFLIIAMREPAPVLLLIIGACLFGALYIERWIFDIDADLFEKNVGLLFLHSRKTRPLSEMQKLVLTEPGLSYQERPSMVRAVSRQAAILSIVDSEGTVFPMDMVKGSSIMEVKQSGERLAEFCGLPFEDRVAEVQPGLR